MKKITILVASAFAFGLTFTSCSGDDDSNNGGSIVGKWTFSTEKVSFGGQTVSEGAYSGNEEGCSTKDYLEIFEASTLERDYYGADCDFDDYTSTYTRSGNTVTTVEDGETYTAEIVSVNSNRLVLRTVEATEAGNVTYEVTLTK